VQDAPADRLVIEYLERMQRVGEQVLDDLCARHPEAANELRVRVDLLTRVGLAWNRTDAEAAPEVAERLRRRLFFRWLAHEAGRGARDEPA
jgi:hypothetical protein